jgi:hypothetical protein
MSTTTTSSTTSSTTTTTSTTTTAMSELSPTNIVNQALERFGARPITDLITDTSVNAQKARRVYDQTRTALLRSHFWRFARARATLSTSTTPDFEWDYQFDLPSDFLRMISVYDDGAAENQLSDDSYALEGKKILSQSATLYIRYIKNVGDVNLMDPLFIEVFILMLAKKLAKAIAQDDKNRIQMSLDSDLKPLMVKVRALDRQEAVFVGRISKGTWNESRHGVRQSNSGFIT